VLVAPIVGNGVSVAVEVGSGVGVLP